MRLMMIRAFWFALGFLIAYIAQEMHYAEEYTDEDEYE